MVNKKFYITTAIDYVNAKPHVGHAFEKVLADALARYHRLNEEKVFFLTGVDENAQKNVEAAQKLGVPVKEFIDKNANLFLDLCKKLNLSHDEFIRTTAKEHSIVVQKIVKKLIDQKDIYKSKYKGLYCVGCETYYTEKDLVDGKCPEHNKEPEVREEEAYFFKLSKYKKQLLKIIPTYEVPSFRANEMLARVNEELSDVCVSRKGAKWGIDFPSDPDYKIWVWIDALINYVSGANNNWPADIHVIGKGINWFHSVIWPAILIAADYKLPKKLLVHGYLNLNGKKMSKSLGNTLDPLELLNKYSADTIRYSLLKCSVFDDSDYSEEILIERNNNELANKLGNLVSRVSALAEKYELKEGKPIDSKKVVNKINDHFDKYEIDKAINEIFAFIDKINEFVQNKKPWETKDQKVLWQAANAIKDIAILLSPFLPDTSNKIAKTFNFEISLKSLKTPLKISKVTKAEVMFTKIETKDQDKIIDNKVNKSEIVEGIMDTSKINYDDFAKLDLRVGKITKAELHPKADKLFVLTVDLGEEKARTIVAGLRKFYSKEQLEGKKAIFVSNLAPVNLRGIESNGMILAASNKDDSKVTILTLDSDIEIGSKIR